MGKEGKEKILFFEKIPLESNRPFAIRFQKIGRTPIHWHEGVTEILLPIRGEVRVSAAFESRTLREGEFWFINHRAIHYLQSEEGALIALIHVNHGYYSSRFPDLPYMFFRSSPILDAEGKIEEGFNDISQEEKSRFCSLLIELLRHELLPEPSGRERRNLGCRLIYTMIYDFYWLRFLESAEGLMNAAHLERYHRIVKYIQEHYAERISLDDIVEGEEGTKAYFAQFLKTFTNNSFTRRVNYERIIKSEFMLLSGHPVLKISGLCGFSDGKYFYQTFKMWYGCLPGDHRKRCQAYSLDSRQHITMPAERCQAPRKSVSALKALRQRATHSLGFQSIQSYPPCPVVFEGCNFETFRTHAFVS